MQQSCPVSFDSGDQAETCAQLFYIKPFITDRENKNSL